MRVLVAVGVPVVVVGVVAGGMTWGASTVERQYERAWEMVAQEGTFEVVDREYDRGLRTSTARTEFALRDPFWNEIAADLSDGAARRLAFVVEDRIDHGPVFFAGDDYFGAARIASEITFDDALREGLPWLGDERPLVTVNTLVDFGGSSTARYASPGFEHEQESSYSVSFSGLSGTSHFNRTFDEQSGDLAAGHFVIEGLKDGGRLSVRDLTMEGDARAIGPSLWGGTTEFSLGEFVVDAQEDALEARGLTGTWELDEEDGLLASDLVLDLARLYLRESRSEDTFDNVRLRMTVSNIDAAVVEQLIEWTEQRDLGQMGENEYTMRTMSTVTELLAANPRVTVEEARMETPEGAFSGTLNAEWTGGPPEMNNPFALFNGLALDFRLTGPEKWWGVALGGMSAGGGAESSQAVRELLEQGLMVRDDGNLTLEFGVRDGMIRAQGETLGSVWQFLGGMGGM